MKEYKNSDELLKYIISKGISVNNEEALNGFKTLCEVEGVIPALESAHAIAYAIKYAKKEENKGKTIIVNLSGRGDKDMNIVAKELGVEI